MHTDNRPLHPPLVVLALVGALLVAGCETSYPEIEALCAAKCKVSPSHTVQPCIDQISGLRDAADDAGCSTAFDVYFACKKKEPPDIAQQTVCLGAEHECAEEHDAIFACARKTASPSACDEANDRLRACGESPDSFLEEQAPLCNDEPYVACIAGCIAGSSCGDLDAAHYDETFSRCIHACPASPLY